MLLAICLIIGLEHLGVFEKISKSPTYGWIINDQTNPYLTDEDKMKSWGYNDTHWGDYQSKFAMEPDGRLRPLTVLTPEEMKIQEDQGCTSCHD